MAMQKWKKFKNQQGFSLTEVIIGIAILTVAIVAATNLLVGLVSTNQNNLTTLQAYYLAQEGIEGVRNIRDSNWLHNNFWLGESSDPWDGKFEVGKSYSLTLNEAGWRTGPSSESMGLNQLSPFAPWKFTSADDVYWVYSGEKSPFKRTVSISRYEQDNSVLVQSKVNWQLGSKDREVIISEVLTDCKGGSL